MVEIVKKGKLKHKHSGVCHLCECEFTYEAEDVTRSTAWDDNHHQTLDFYFIDCPYCRRTISLYPDKILITERDKMKHDD